MIPTLSELLTTPSSTLPWLFRRLLLPVVWLLLPVCALCQVLNTLPPSLWHPISQQALISYNVYAYRDWQSVGIFLETSDRYHLTAQGQWQYSPVIKFHGPRGNPLTPGFEYDRTRPLMPLTYPSPNLAGGALLGRVGETGAPFFVGMEAWGYADQPGLLYFRINDDLLGDNEGHLTLAIVIERTTPPAP